MKIQTALLAIAAIVLGSAPAIGQTCPSIPGTVARWSADGTAADITGAHNGAMAGTAAFAEGISGQAFALDGQAGYVAVPDSPDLNPTSAITLAAWVYVTGLGDRFFPPILKKNGPSDDRGYTLELIQEGQGAYFGVWGIGAALADGIPVAQWTHVAGTYDGRMLRLFINGALVDSREGIGTMLPSQGELHIGHDPVLGRHFQGRIDEPAVFDRALSPSEIEALAMPGGCGSASVGVIIRSHGFTYGKGGVMAASLVANGEPVTGKALEFLILGASAGNGLTDAAGLVTLPLPSGVNAGSYADGLEVRFAGDQDLESLVARSDLVVYQYLPTINWQQPPSDIVFGTTLSAVHLNATVDAPGTLTYDPPAGTVTDRVGPYELSVSFIPDDARNYAPSATVRTTNVQWPNLTTGQSSPVVIGRIAGGRALYVDDVHPVIDTLRGLVYVPDFQDGTVVVADERQGQTIKALALNAGATSGVAGAMALDQAANRLFVADQNQPLLWVIDPAADAPVIQVLPLPDIGRWLQFNPSTGLLYTLTDEAVVVTDPADASATVSIALGECGADSLTIDPVTNLVYAPNRCGTRIIDGEPQRAISFNTIIGDLEIPPFFGHRTAVAVGGRAGRVYVLAFTSEEHNAVYVFDGDPGSPTFRQQLDVFSLARPGGMGVVDWSLWPTAIAIDSSRDLVYVRASDWQGNNMCESTLTAVDVVTGVLASITMLPWDDQNCSWGRVAVNPQTGRIFITSNHNVTSVLQEARTTTLATGASAMPVTVETRQVSLTFAAVTAPGQTTVEQVDTGSLSASLPGGFQIAGGAAFEISTTAGISAPIQLCFNAAWVTDPAQFAMLAVLHGENGVFVDRTVSRDFATATICASVSSLSPFVIAQRVAPAFHLEPLHDVTKPVPPGGTILMRVKLLGASDQNASAADVTLRVVSIVPISGDAAGAVTSPGRSNPNGFFRYDSALGAYLFNLSTHGLKAGSYRLLVEGPDAPLRYVVPFQIR